MSNDEILYFKRPPLSARLICFDLSPQVSQQELETLFSTFGPLQSLIKVGEYAFIYYYSSVDATRALYEIGSDNFGENLAAPRFYGKRIRVSRQKKEKLSSTSAMFEKLQHDEAANMANYFFGFDGWMSSIVELTEINLVHDGGNVIFEETSSSSSSSSSSAAAAFQAQQVEASEEPKHQSHWFATVRVDIPRFKISVTIINCQGRELALNQRTV
jgi:RNA recognition motif-containing protein